MSTPPRWLVGGAFHALLFASAGCTSGGTANESLDGTGTEACREAPYSTLGVKLAGDLEAFDISLNDLDWSVSCPNEADEYDGGTVTCYSDSAFFHSTVVDFLFPEELAIELGGEAPETVRPAYEHQTLCGHHANSGVVQF